MTTPNLGITELFGDYSQLPPGAREQTKGINVPKVTVSQMLNVSGNLRLTGAVKTPLTLASYITTESGDLIIDPASGVIDFSGATISNYVTSEPTTTEYIEFEDQGSDPDNPDADHLRIWSDASSRLTWKTAAGNRTTLNSTSITENRVYTFPDANTTFVGDNTTQTLTGKTLTAPTIATITNSGTLTLPTTTDTLVGRATTDTLTNKTLSNAIFTGWVINNNANPIGLDSNSNIARLTNIATTDTSQILSNKSLDNPALLNIASNDTSTVLALTGGGNVVTRTNVATTNTTQTLTGKTLTAPTIATITNSGTLTLPTTTDTLVGRATTDTLTNKTINSTSNSIQISGSSIDAIIDSSNPLLNVSSPMFVSLRLTSTSAPDLICSRAAENRRKILLYDNENNNENQCYSIGTTTNTFRLQLESTNASFRFYQGTSSSTSRQIAALGNDGGVNMFRISGDSLNPSITLGDENGGDGCIIVRTSFNENYFSGAVVGDLCIRNKVSRVLLGTSESTPQIIIESGMAGNVSIHTGLVLPTSGGSASTLDYYESGSFTAGYTGAITTFATWQFVRIGKMVTVNIPLVDVGAGSATSITISNYPSRLLPSTIYTSALLIVIDNGTTQANPGKITIPTMGNPIIYKTLDNGNFTAAITAGHELNCFSYIIN